MSFDGKVSFTEELRYLEQSEDLFEIHCELIEWGIWCRSGIGDPLGNRLRPQGIWSLPGQYDPGTDEEAAPESPKPKVNIKRVLELDQKISAARFLDTWRKVLKANYVLHVPEYQRPEEAGIGESRYLEFLEHALEDLCK